MKMEAVITQEMYKDMQQKKKLLTISSFFSSPSPPAVIPSAIHSMLFHHSANFLPGTPISLKLTTQMFSHLITSNLYINCAHQGFAVYG
jgi:hypothetical protein